MAEEGAPREVMLLADGETIQYFNSAGVPEDWFSTMASLAWAEGKSGFGPSGRYRQVGTLMSFPRLKLRKIFSLIAIPATLKLSLRHEAKPFSLYLNGVEVLSLDGGNSPVPDAAGFRHYDLPGGVGALKLGSNLFALAVEGNVVSPVLTGVMVVAEEYPLTMKPGDAYQEEGHTFDFQVHRSYGFEGQSIGLETGAGGMARADFEIWKDGAEIDLSPRGNGAYSFIGKFAEGESILHFKLLIRDDAHAEGAESVAVVCRASRLICVIPPNDTMVSRANPSGEGSLRQAIFNANLRTGPDVICFVDEEGVLFSQYPVTLNFAPGELGYGISGGVQIEGPDSPGRVTIHANGASLFHASPDFIAKRNSPMVLRRLVIQGASPALGTLRYDQDVLLEDCEFLQNIAPLDLYVLDTRITIRNCLFLGNANGAVSFYTFGSPLAALMENCTVVDTAGEVLAGAREKTEVRHCTITQSGQMSFQYGTAKWRNCLISLLVPGGGGSFAVDSGGNLYGSSELGHPAGIGGTASRPMEPGLEPLAFNGGFTRTRAIRADSRALDSAVPGFGEVVAFDQRGAGFPRKVGKSADAGAFERQILTSDLPIGAATDVVYDSVSGLYFQVVSVTNRSPWDLSGFRLSVEGLPPGVEVYNTSGGGGIDFARDMTRQSPVYLVIQYRAENPFLRIEPVLRLTVTPDAARPLAPPRALSAALTTAPDGRMVLEMTVTPQRSYRIQFSGDLKIWQDAGPARYAESRSLHWKDDGRDTGIPPSGQAIRFYRILEH